MSEFEDVLGALAKETVMGRSHLWSWWCLSLTLDQKPELLKKVPIFLGLTLKAHVNEAWLTLAKLYEKGGRGRATMKCAVELAERNAGQFRNATAEEVRRFLPQLKKDEVQSIENDIENKGKEIKTYRDEAIAHLNVTRLPEGGSLSVLNKMVGRPQTLLGTVDEPYKHTQRLLNDMSKAYRGTGILDFERGDPPGCNENSEICLLLG